jgi:hypothetical protein
MGSDISVWPHDQEYPHSISISSEGSIIVIGASGYPYPHPGEVISYRWEGQEWHQMGSIIEGKKPYDRFGFSTSLSDNGLRLVACSHNSQYIQVYEFRDNNWFQVGKDIWGGKGSAETHDVDISANGNIVAVGAANSPQPNIHRGVVRVYHYMNGAWEQLGDDILGENDKDQSGWSISLSDEGNMVAIGAMGNDNGGEKSGHVRIFTLSNGQWEQIGNDIRGRMAGDHFGTSVSLSANGQRVAIGCLSAYSPSDETGYVTIYEHNSGDWVNVGGVIIGQTDEHFGSQVSLNAEGNRVVVYSSNNDNCPIRIFDYNGESWLKSGNSIKSDRLYNDLGHGIGISADGQRVAAVSQSGGGGGGFVQVYDISNISIEDYDNEDCEVPLEEVEEEIKMKVFPNPTFGEIRFEGIELTKLIEDKRILLYDALGREISGYLVAENSIDISIKPSGVYLLKVLDRVEKIIKVSL